MNKGLERDFKEQLRRVAAKYKACFVGKEIKYVYRDKQNKRRELFIGPKEQNFMHLCGIGCYGDGLNDPLDLGKKNLDGSKGAKQFYSACIEGRLAMGDIWFNDINSVEIKLAALENLDSLFKQGVCICNYGTYERLSFQNAVRTSEIILALTFIKSCEDFLIPNSAINLRSGKADTSAFKETYKVTSITVKDIGSGAETTKDFKNKIGQNKKQRRDKKKAKQKRDRIL